MKKLPDDVTKYILDKYGQKNLRMCGNFWGANIPEKYWMKEIHQENLDEIIGVENEIILVFGNVKNHTRVVSDLLKIFIVNHIDAERADFATLISQLSEYGDFNVGKAMEYYDTTKVIGITGIRYGDMFNSYSERLIVLINNLMDSRIEKKLIIGMEGRNDIDKLGKMYGEDFIEAITSLNYKSITA